eukprot:9591938-Karenia_brevis.AAC.1
MCYYAHIIFTWGNAVVVSMRLRRQRGTAEALGQCVQKIFGQQKHFCNCVMTAGPLAMRPTSPLRIMH